MVWICIVMCWLCRTTAWQSHTQGPDWHNCEYTIIIFTYKSSMYKITTYMNAKYKINKYQWEVDKLTRSRYCFVVGILCVYFRREMCRTKSLCRHRVVHHLDFLCRCIEIQCVLRSAQLVSVLVYCIINNKHLHLVFSTVYWRETNCTSLYTRLITLCWIAEWLWLWQVIIIRNPCKPNKECH